MDGIVGGRRTYSDIELSSWRGERSRIELLAILNQIHTCTHKEGKRETLQHTYIYIHIYRGRFVTTRFIIRILWDRSYRFDILDCSISVFLYSFFFVRPPNKKIITKIAKDLIVKFVSDHFDFYHWNLIK